MASKFSNPSNPNTRLKAFREFLGESQRVFGLRFEKAQRTYANYEDEGASIPPEVREGSARLGLNLNWLDTGEGPMTLPVKEVPNNTIGGTGWSQPPEERHRAEAVRRALVKEGLEERPIPSLDGPTLQHAAQLLDEELFKGRPWREDLRWELIAQIGRQVVEAKREGFQGADLEKEIRRRIHAWIQAAHDLGTPG